MSYADDFEQIEYDPYEDIHLGWIQSDRSRIKLEVMTSSHIKNAMRICNGMAVSSSSTDEGEKWESWVDAFEEELASRTSKPSNTNIADEKKPQRGAKLKLRCHCGKEYLARKAYWNRGWARSCSKRCAAIKREYGKPDAKRL